MADTDLAYKISIMQYHLDGGAVGIKNSDGSITAVTAPKWNWENFNYVKYIIPEPINLNIFVNTNILMEFSDDGFVWELGYLTAITATNLYEDHHNKQYTLCRVATNRVYKHDRSINIPIPEGYQITYWDGVNGGQTDSYISGSLWESIEFYRIDTVLETWAYPWQIL